jgi:tetratricopeptide (TPR) repeat protein
LDFSKHIQKAEEAARRKNYDFAVELYQQLLEIDPDQGDARAGLRRVLKKRHEAKQGGRFLRALSGAAPLTLARTLRKAGRHDACAKSLESYLATSPLNVEANLMLGRELEAAGHFQSARAVYEFVAEIDPRNPEGLKSAGEMVRRAGDPVAALKYYERALDADPRDQDALKARKNLAAETALQSGGFETARHSRDQIKDKDEARALERSQRLHLSEGELREELERLEGRFSEAPSNPDLMVEMAGVHEKLEDPEAALDMLERAADYRKGSFDLVRRLGGLKSKVLKRRLSRADKDGNAEEASRIEEQLRYFQVESARSLLSLRPADAGLRVQLGKLLLRSGSHDEALAEFQKAVDDPRQKADALFYLGQAFQKKGFGDLARKHFERALEGAGAGDDRTKEILYNLGEIAEAEGEDETARSWYSRIFEVDIGYRDVAGKMERFK